MMNSNWIKNFGDIRRYDIVLGLKSLLCIDPLHFDTINFHESFVAAKIRLELMTRHQCRETLSIMLKSEFVLDCLNGQLSAHVMLPSEKKLCPPSLEKAIFSSTYLNNKGKQFLLIRVEL